MNRKSFIFFTITGALVAIVLLNYYLNMTYSSKGSFDIIIGAFVEVFILTVFFEYASAKDRKKQDLKNKQHMQKIEQQEINIQKHITSIKDELIQHISRNAQQPQNISAADPAHKNNIQRGDQ
jgi:hypothetical protein